MKYRYRSHFILTNDLKVGREVELLSWHSLRANRRKSHGSYSDSKLVPLNIGQ